MRLKSLFVFALAAMIAAPALAARPIGPPGQSIVKKLERAGQFEILLTALETAGLKDTLARGGPFTLFAPTDAAFGALLDELGIPAEELLANPDLAQILLYHVLPGRQGAATLLQASTASTLNGQPVLAMLEGRQVKVNRVTVIRPNVKAGNGVIHVVEGVLLPPTEPITLTSVLDVLVLDGRFTVLLAALEATGLDDAVATTPELTLFAPTDDAFAALLAELGITSEELLASPELSNTLLYHVTAGRLGAAELLKAGSATTLQGGDVTVGLRADGVYVNDSRVINPNVNAPNGVLHVIDAVLQP